MGDRALVICHIGRKELSPVAYLHWHGSAVGRFIEAAIPQMRRGDVSYSFARMIGTFHTQIEGNCGLGCFNSPDTFAECEAKDFSHGDAGVFLLDVDTGMCECFNGYGFDREAYDEPKMARNFGTPPR